MNDNCHLCNGKLFPNPVLELSGMPKAAQYYPEKNEFDDDRGVVLTIRQCSSCGLVQHTMRPVDYFKEVITAATLSEKSRLSRLNQMKDFSAKFNLAGKKVVEIGTGKGEMVEVINEAGMIGAGLEFSEESVKMGSASGRKIIQGYIGEADKIKDAPFDAFISLNYLEHLPQPGQVIQNIYRNTTNDAAGFVTVPNFEYLLKTKSLYEFVPDHISYFTQKTLTHAFETNGFEVLECRLINEDNDIAVTVKKRKPLNLTEDYKDVEALIKDFRNIIADYKSKGKKVATWGAGHRTLTFIALSKVKDIEYVVDSAKFKQGKFTPVSHFKIMPPNYLKEKKVDLVIVMVPGLYPSEVIKILKEMNTGARIASLQDNKIEFIN